MGAPPRQGRDAHVNPAVSRLLAVERKADKARKFFSRATKLDKDFGDAWAAALAFELDVGAPPADVAALEAACAAAEPKHGEAWQRVAKAPDARGLTLRDVLHRVAPTMRDAAAAAKARAED